MGLTRRTKRSRYSALIVCIAALLAAGQVSAQAVLVLQPGSGISTLAGNGSDGHIKAGDARLSPLGSPGAAAYDTTGNLYFADTRNHQVSRIDTTGALTVIAGTGRQGFAGDGGPAAAAELNAPGGIALDTAGNIFIADTGNQRIRRIASSDGTVTTVAGSGVAGFSGDTGPGIAARLRFPSSLAMGTSGALYIADTGNHRVCLLRTDGTLVTVAGNGSEGDNGDGGPALAAALDAPSGLALLPDGRLLIADRGAHRVRILQTDGTIAAYSTGAAGLRRPVGLATDTAGSVFVADAAEQRVMHSSADGASSFAGSSGQGALQSGSPLATALDSPTAVAYRSNGDVAISDTHNHQVQRVSLPSLNFGSIPTGSVSKPQILTLQNGGSVALTLLAVELPSGFARLDDSSTCNLAPLPLQAADQCKIAITFAPVAQGPGDALAQVRLLGGAPQSLLLKGTGTASGSLAGSITALRSDGSIAYSGAPITFTATVAGSLLRTPAGNVSFLDGANVVATSTLAGGTTTLATAALSTGAHSLRAVYSGDAVYSGSTSPAVTLTVVPSPDFTMTASAASYSGKSGGTVAIPMTLLPVNGTLNRPVQFAVTGLPAGAMATFAPATLTLGGTTAAVTLTVQMPTTLSRNDPAQYFEKLLASSLVLAGLLYRRRRSLAGLLALGVISICITGCGSGFRAGTTAANLPGTSHTYTGVVTATTTGVLGAPLAHSTSIGLVITQ